MAEMRSPEFKEKMNKGPVMMVTFMPNGQMNMGKSLGCWFLYLVAVSFCAGYVAFHTLVFGATYHSVFRIVGVTAFLGYSAALWQMSIWYRRSLCTTIKATIDGALYAALTAGTFGWLWPR
jgi:hypothetical protein